MREKEIAKKMVEVRDPQKEQRLFSNALQRKANVGVSDKHLIVYYDVHSPINKLKLVALRLNTILSWYSASLAQTAVNKR